MFSWCHRQAFHSFPIEFKPRVSAKDIGVLWRATQTAEAPCFGWSMCPQVVQAGRRKPYNEVQQAPAQPFHKQRPGDGERYSSWPCIPQWGSIAMEEWALTYQCWALSAVLYKRQAGFSAGVSGYKTLTSTLWIKMLISSIAHLKSPHWCKNEMLDAFSFWQRPNMPQSVSQNQQIMTITLHANHDYICVHACAWVYCYSL